MLHNKYKRKAFLSVIAMVIGVDAIAYAQGKELLWLNPKIMDYPIMIPIYIVLLYALGCIIYKNIKPREY